MLICDKCGAGINAGSKFCPQCGDPVTEADQSFVLVTNSQVANVEIIFGQSSSPNFAKAVDICKNIPSYSVSGEDKQVKHSISLSITEVDLITNLFDLVGSWKSSQMLINGRAASKKDLTYYGVGCYKNRQKAYKPEQFCFGEKDYEANIWGCKRLNMPIYEWGGGWLDYGQFDKSGAWHFDKDRIKHELEITLKENELCPVLDRKRVLETLDKLPNSINPKTDNNWQYKTNYEEVNGDYKEVAVGIKPIIKKINRYIIGSYHPTWESSPTESDQKPNNERTITVNLKIEDDKPKAIAALPKAETKNSKFTIWIIAAIIIILFFVFK